MGAPKVTTAETDRSTRVPEFPGVYNTIVIPAKKGRTDIPELIGNEQELLRRYTPDETIKVGYDNAYFSALAALDKTNKLWVMRAHNASLFGGIFCEAGTSYTAAEAAATGDGSTATIAFTLSNLPALAGSVTITAGDIVITDDGLGKFRGSGITASSSTINYTTGAVSIVYTTAPENGVAVTVAYSQTVSGTNRAAVIGQSDPEINQDFGASASAWVTLTAHVIGDQVIPVAANGYFYECTVAGTTDSSEPSWPTTIGSTVVDDTVTWKCVAKTTDPLYFYGANQGVWNNSIKIKIAIDAATVKEDDAFIVYIYKGTVLKETWTCSRRVKKDGYGTNIYIEDVLLQSEYIRCKDNSTISEYVLPAAQTTSLAMATGSDGGTVTDSHMVAAVDIFANKAAYPTTLILDGGWATVTYALKIINICETRGDCYGILSSSYADEAVSSYLTDIKAYVQSELNNPTSYAGIYTPHLYVFDKYNDRDLYVSPDGYIAAVINETAANEDLWIPPAGPVRGKLNVKDTRQRLSSTDMDALYDANINPIEFAIGKGIRVKGQKTLLTRPSSLDRANVRLALIIIEPAVQEALEDFLFRFNDVSTRSQIYTVIDAYMSNMKGRDAVEDYYLKCDAENNTANDIENYKLIVDLFIKPKKAIEFIEFTVVITRQDVNVTIASELL